MIEREEDFRKEAVKVAAYLMSISARTAPKSKGEDDIEIIYVDGEDKDRIANAMIEHGNKSGIKGFIRDGESVKVASGILLIGVNGGKPLKLNCGACGYASCEEFQAAGRRQGRDFAGPNCMFKLLDLGIAIGSAVKLASMINVDNRIMYRIGTIAKALGIAKADVVMGIPLSSTGKNPFFDREMKK
ncbi:ferredoxin domain-containing protein [Archaeoglobus veneficus]|uniref:4Fe-4S domain-containing protein n=1 Tax=Archaeoglobus veneficus (strain DSM 11195 / SNP6) TaxID=693661 RepID=F2KPE4_ARCVS|nr:DUF2148 domain-containing protein [Archaeoglobus veneficus]AEA46375.1 Protein of unknown function DUF2148 [Archaeoglobus veneficus SNP6]